MSNCTIYVVRHGRTTANASGLLLGRADPELDPTGYEQAKRLATVVPEDAYVLASPLKRTQQTAAALTETVHTDERLIELDYGHWDLRPVREVTADEWSHWRANIGFCPPEGESIEALTERVSNLLDEIAHDPPAPTVALVTHVSPIKAALAWALGVGPEVCWRSTVAQASVMTIGVTARRPSLHGFNFTHHLD